ncbi:MAG: stimulus-sensing domain-containing protein [Rhizomicrobium sp.]
MVVVPQRSRFSALSRRIILFNAFALVVLIAGVLTVQSNRASLVDERLSGIQQQAQIVASTIAEYTADENSHSVDENQAKPLMRQLLAPTRLRGRLYDINGNLLVDSRYLLARNVVQIQELPPLGWWDRLKASVARFYDGLMGVRPFTHLDPYFEAGNNGRVYSEVTTALAGEPATAERVDDRNRLVLSVAMPIQRFKAIYGVLLVSTEGGDIDDILREERATLIQVFLVAVAVMVISSLFLARFIAEPVQRLARAADEVRGGHAGRGTIPIMDERRDEIGDLAQSLSAMTRALHDRIDAIERFAADVAHELKNPLTLAQERGGDAEPRRHRRAARPHDGHRAQRREAHRPTDHRHLGRLAPRRRAQPRDLGARRPQPPARDHHRSLSLHGNLQGSRRKAGGRAAGAGERAGARRAPRPGVPQPDRQCGLVQQGRRHRAGRRPRRGRRGAGDGRGTTGPASRRTIWRRSSSVFTPNGRTRISATIRA